MLSDKQNHFLKIKKSLQSGHEDTGQTYEKNTNACNKFHVTSDCVGICQRTSRIFQEQSNELSEVPENDSERHFEAFEHEDSNDNMSDDEDVKLCFEETAESSNGRCSPHEISDSDDGGDEEKEHQEEKCRMVYENECNLDSVYGLNEIKELLLNVVVYPAFYPQFFPRGIRWNQILLYGPPGTGKTMLAKALALEINAALHRITSADLLSHWQGQTEKQIRDLFQTIRTNSEPTILFFDEIDGLFRKRTSAEDESTRRIKTELLIRLDDFTAEIENHQTFLIGATNCPWEIDSSFMRRFHKKIFVPLPNKETRLEIIKNSFANIKTDLTDLQWSEIGERTEGYSGSDLVNVVMTSCCERFMQIKKSKYWKARGYFWIPIRSYSLFSTEKNFEDIHPDKVGIRNIIFTDLTKAITKTPKTVGSEELSKYLEFSKQN